MTRRLIITLDYDRQPNAAAFEDGVIVLARKHRLALEGAGQFMLPPYTRDIEWSVSAKREAAAHLFVNEATSLALALHVDASFAISPDLDDEDDG